ncbi:15377_t:CDS:2 [Acaulospora morrowiae]|uniref:15377_t:CDS:1 n=1 Tax=Acaulospora morrowiae TaxID=94023 RepID=A0A9N9E0W3_9GLOM|nr:15377_t:CDS:2 [Acaulospora morrowiae]
MTQGVLKVTVVGAKNLKDEDAIGKSDPFVELWIDHNYKQRTTTKQGTLNPVWNETFTFNLTSSNHTLHLRVLDDDTVKDDKIGDTKVDLKEVIQHGRVDKEYKIPALFGLSNHGFVHLILEHTHHH